jgi:hypothetical protein
MVFVSRVETSSIPSGEYSTYVWLEYRVPSAVHYKSVCCALRFNLWLCYNILTAIVRTLELRSCVGNCSQEVERLLVDR